MPLKWIRTSGNGGLLPPPRAPGLPGSRFILRKSGRPDLRWGRAGEGGRSYGAKLHPPTATPTPNPSPAGCGLARFRQYESDQPRQAGVGWGREHTVRVATSCIQLKGTRFSVPIPKFASLRDHALLLLLRGGALGCGPRACRLRSERIVGQPVPDLAAAEQRNAEIAAHLELLTIRAELHQRAVNRSIARIHDRPILVGHSVALHSLDQRQSQHRSAFLGAFALVADPVLVLAGLLEDLDDVAFVGTVALDDLEPALGLSGVLIDLLPQAYG